MPSGLYSKLEDYVASSGSSKTDVIISALTSYLKSSDELPLVERVAQIEQRLVKLELNAMQ